MMRNTIRSILLCTAALALASPAQAALKVLTTFNEKNGEDVFAAPIQGTDGHIYGATSYGGKANYGTVYRLSPDGRHKVLYSFCSQANCADGSFPEWLTQGADGNLYGQTYQGGTAGAGTIFKLTTGGQLTTLYSFCAQANCTDGALPQSALVQTTDGSFYGTTVIGGANNQGTIFKFVPGSGLTTLYSFCPQAGCADGAQPNIGLTLASDGNFYGTAALGGHTQCQYGCGTVYKITPGGTFTTIYTFCNPKTGCPDGNIPQGVMIEGEHGDLYGTTDGGGDRRFGTVFKITLSGQLTTLHNFCDGNCTDGGIPYAGVIRATDGNFYGTANVAGPGGYGTVYKMTPSGTVTTLFGFDLKSDGGFPAASLLQASDGKFYGGTEQGGDNNCSAPSGCGVLFRVSAKANGVFADPVGSHSVTHAANAAAASSAIPVSPISAHRPIRP